MNLFCNSQSTAARQIGYLLALLLLDFSLSLGPGPRCWEWHVQRAMTYEMRIKPLKPQRNGLARFWTAGEKGGNTYTNPRVEVMVQFNLALGCVILSLFDCLHELRLILNMPQ